jgi:hypothetical protein
MKELALRYPDVAINVVVCAGSSLRLHLSGELSYQASNISLVSRGNRGSRGRRGRRRREEGE